MANKVHLEILRKGVNAWNQWRVQNPEKTPDLSGANLPGADLAGANLSMTSLFRAILSGANLREANLAEVDLRRAILLRADLREADLTGADLTGADLRGTILGGANLRAAILSEANLCWADLTGTNLRGTDLRAANLTMADFRGGNLTDSNFSDAWLWFTTFADNDLSVAKGLDAVRHRGPSTVGIDTIYRSKGSIPDAFLRGAGVPDQFIKYMKSIVEAGPIEFYSCFISYSSKDQDFAERLHADLQSKGVGCWFAPEDLKISDKFRSRIDISIRIHDKLLVVLSEDSIRSAWVEKEVETAFEKERQQNKIVLFPIRLDDAVMKTDQAWAADIRRTRHIGDFRGWRDHDRYQVAYARLLRDLKADAATPKPDARGTAGD